MASIFEFIGSLGKRAKDSKHTTIGGGVAGVAFAALIGQLETASGCHFQEAFAGMDWLQVAGYVFMQSFGAISTDAKKTV
jgi:hypothetical protein